MKKHIQILIFIVTSTFSYETFSECAIELPFEELSDCIVMELAGGNYVKQRDHIPTGKTVLSMDHQQANAIDNFIKISSNEAK